MSGRRDIGRPPMARTDVLLIIGTGVCMLLSVASAIAAALFATLAVSI